MGELAERIDATPGNFVRRLPSARLVDDSISAVPCISQLKHLFGPTMGQSSTMNVAGWERSAFDLNIFTRSIYAARKMLHSPASPLPSATNRIQLPKIVLLI
jgi:hypothetical protein